MVFALTFSVRVYNFKNFHDFVAEVVDDFYGDAAGFGFAERAGGVAVEGGPGFGVDFGFQGGFQGVVGVVGAQEISVADEEAFLVVVGVNEPAGNSIRAITADFAGIGVKNIHPIHLHAQFAVLLWQDRNVRLAKNDKEVSFARVFEVFGHV